MAHQTIIVLDFGSQFTQLIARRLRELSVYSEVWPPDTPIEKLRARNPAGIILSGGGEWFSMQADGFGLLIDCGIGPRISSITFIRSTTPTWSA